MRRFSHAPGSFGKFKCILYGYPNQQRAGFTMTSNNLVYRKVKSAWKKLLVHIRDPNLNQQVEQTFHRHQYLNLTMRSLEHLASLELPLHNRSVLEVGAGAGDFSGFFLDRACRVTITDVRPQLLAYLQRRYPQQDIRRLDLEQPTPLSGDPFEVVFCYGVLYHLRDPAKAVEFMSDCCTDLFLVSSQVTGNEDVCLTEMVEPAERLAQSYHGCGTRFTRRWLYNEIHRHFPYVYTPRTQPAHFQFPCDWSALDGSKPLVRANFVASRKPLTQRLLTEQWIDQQEIMS